MTIRTGLRLFLFFFIAAFSVSSVVSQTPVRKKRPSRRVTNPVRSTSRPADGSSTDPSIISTADDNSADGSKSPATKNSSTQTAGSTPEAKSRETIDRLTTQLSQMNDRINQMEDDQRSLGNIERLSRAQQRAEDLRAQLRDVESRELDFQARMEQVDYDLQPDNIDKSVAMIGSTKPEDIRETRRQQLLNEKKRVQGQIDLLEKSKTRLEAAIATADLEVQRLSERIQAIEDASKPKTNVPPDNTQASQPAIP